MHRRGEMQAKVEVKTPLYLYLYLLLFSASFAVLR
jgi:hypothetical protein